MSIEQYRPATDEEFENRNCNYNYDMLVGPNGFECLLTEPEDRRWCRDLRPVVAELNRLSSVRPVDEQFVREVEDRLGAGRAVWGVVNAQGLCQAVLDIAAKR